MNEGETCWVQEHLGEAQLQIHQVPNQKYIHSHSVVEDFEHSFSRDRIYTKMATTGTFTRSFKDKLVSTPQTPLNIRQTSNIKYLNAFQSHMTMESEARNRKEEDFEGVTIKFPLVNENPETEFTVLEPLSTPIRYIEVRRKVSRTQ